MRIKKYKEIPIHVVEDHNEVLPHIFKSMGSMHLPLQNNTLVHFDSHPDMLIPHDLVEDDFMDKYELFSKLSIENWIMPAVYAGHFHKLIWIKQTFCNQIQDGKYEFHIGKCKSSGKIKLTATNAYFLSEVLYAPLDELEKTKSVTLIVATMDTNEDMLKELFRLEQDTYVLDIDLDYFSTKNPFQELYKIAGLYDRLKRIYKCKIPNTDSPSEIMAFVEERTKQLENLKTYFHNVGKTDETFDHLFEKHIQKELNELVVEVNKHYTMVEWDLIHEAGCTCDEIDKSLPHHVTEDNQLVPLINSKLQSWFSIADGHLPIMITISRSSADDYCPIEQVDLIENHVLTKLRQEYNTSALYLHYQYDSD